MSTPTSSQWAIKQAWQSPTGRKAMWVLMVATFLLIVILGSLVREKEKQFRQTTLISLAQTLASTVMNPDSDENDILLKVSDLLNVKNILGVRLHQGTDTPLSVGDTLVDFPNVNTTSPIQTSWNDSYSQIDIAIKMDKSLPFDWFVMRLDGDGQIKQPIFGTLINWVAAPIIALFNGLIFLWIYGRYFLKPILAVQSYLQDNNGKYALTQVPQELTDRTDESGLLAKQIEIMRSEVNEAKAKVEFQARFLHETPYALIRCSVNRKVLYANIAARAENALFGDESKEFISPALSELVRKAFYESKQVNGDIRCHKQIITFRAIPVLDAGYVNLYGEVTKKVEGA